MTSFATKSLKFGVALDERSCAKWAAVCRLDLFSLNKILIAKRLEEFLGFCKTSKKNS